MDQWFWKCFTVCTQLKKLRKYEFALQSNSIWKTQSLNFPSFFSPFWEVTQFSLTLWMYVLGILFYRCMMNKLAWLGVVLVWQNPENTELYPLSLCFFQLFKLEDVAMGIWIDEFKNKDQQVNYISDERFYNTGCESNYILAHYQGPRKVLCLWEMLQKEQKPVCCE